MEATKFNFISNQIDKIVLENNQHNEINYLIIPNQDIDFDLNIVLNHNEVKHINIGIYNYLKYKINCNVNVSFKNKNNECLIYVTTLGSDQSNTNICIDAKVTTENNKIIQNIKGFLLSEKATITGLPVLNIETNQIIASHGLAIGSLNKEQFFYLMTKGFNSNEVKKILLLSQFENLLSKCEQKEKEMYLEKINNLWSKNND